MKVQCNSCGCHFKEDFDITQTPACNWWGDYKMANLPVDWKKRIWDWIFSCPTDEMEEQIGMSMIMTFFATPFDKSKQDFSAFVQGWDQMDEVARREYQREFYKKMGNKGGIKV